MKFIIRRAHLLILFLCQWFDNQAFHSGLSSSAEKGNQSFCSPSHLTLIGTSNVQFPGQRDELMGVSAFVTAHRLVLSYLMEGGVA